MRTGDRAETCLQGSTHLLYGVFMAGAETQSAVLDVWICDICGDQIEDPGVALVIWRESPDRHMHEFKIVHKSMDDWRCRDQADRDGYRASYELGWCLGMDGLTTLLSWLSHGPVDGGGHPDLTIEDLNEYVDLVRRLQIHYYEQARRRFRNREAHERLAFVNPIFPYTQESLHWAAGPAASRLGALLENF